MDRKPKMTTPDEQAAPAAPSTVPWPPILLAGAAAAAVALGHLVPIRWPGESDLMARIIGHGVGIAGLALFFWAAWTLRRHGTTIRSDKAADMLVTDGPFRIRRNPIYIAHVLIFLGVAEITQNIWFAILAFVYGALVTQFAILPEERHLEARFGDAYRAYKARTRRLI